MQLDKAVYFYIYSSIMDPVMKKAVALFEISGMTLDELGQAMGYQGKLTRQTAWQFLNKTADPRFSMVRKFCKAMGVTLEELVSEKNGKRKGQPE
jgi:transcriptional regulator with XRE-family HTH domain